MTDDQNAGPGDEEAAALDRELRHVTALLARSAPEPPPLPMPGVRPVSPSRLEPARYRWLAAAAAAVLVVGGVGWWLVSRADPVQPVATEGAVIAHQQIRWSQEVELSCEGGSEVGVHAAQVDVFVDTAGQRVRQRVISPDGAVRDQIWEGPADEPTRRFERGASTYAAPTCPDWGLVASDDTRGLMGRLAAPPDFTPGDADGRRRSIVPGEHADDIGRSAELLREESDGLAQLDDGGASAGVPFHQTFDWYVEPDSGRLLQSRTREEVEGVSTVTTTMVVITDDEVAMTPGLFDTDGYDLVYEAPGPDPGYVTAEAVAPAVQVGADRYWPPDPAPGDDPEATALRFATEVLGWSDLALSRIPGSPEQGPQLVTVHDRRGHSVELLLVPAPSGGWELLQIEEGGANVGYDPDGNDQLDLPFPAGTAEVVIEAHLDPGGPRAWRAAITESTAGVVLPGTADDPAVRLIVLYRDADGHTIGADTLGFGRLADPSTPATEPTPAPTR